MDPYGRLWKLDDLTAPLRTRKPYRYRVGVDLFDLPDDEIDQVFAVMALRPQHSFQVLTKRPERMAEYFSGNTLNDVAERMIRERDAQRAYSGHWLDKFYGRYMLTERWSAEKGYESPYRLPKSWPLPNVWLGTSASTQADLDRNVPHLLKCPAAVRFISLEPLVEGVDLHRAKAMWCDSLTAMGVPPPPMCREVSWVIAGGESGPNARPCRVDWIRSVVGQCKAAGVPCFVKQIGAKCIDTPPGQDPHFMRGMTWYRTVSDKKGGKPDEWPADLRVRQWPEQENKP